MRLEKFGMCFINRVELFSEWEGLFVKVTLILSTFKVFKSSLDVNLKMLVKKCFLDFSASISDPIV